MIDNVIETKGQADKSFTRCNCLESRLRFKLKSKNSQAEQQCTTRNGKADSAL